MEIEGHELTVLQLISEMHGGPIPFPKLLKQISEADDNEEDFVCIYNEIPLIVRLPKIKEYFIAHAKPERPMGMEEENKFLKNRVLQLETEIRVLKGEKEPQVEPEKPKVVTPSMPDLPAELTGESTKGEVIPERMDNAPSKTVTVEDLTAELKEEFKDVKPEKVASSGELVEKLREKKAELQEKMPL